MTNLTDGQIQALAGQSNTEPFKMGKVSPTYFIRVWMAKKDFFPAVNRNTCFGNAHVQIIHERIVWKGNNGFPVETTEPIDLPTEVYISIFFTPENYDAVCNIASDNVEDAFDLCGNNPEHAERWYHLFRRRSLSVGDVVEVVKDGKSNFLVCASQGWKPILREINLTEEEEKNLYTIKPEKWRV